MVPELTIIPIYSDIDQLLTAVMILFDDPMSQVSNIALQNSH